jgi:hypothetical protein
MLLRNIFLFSSSFFVKASVAESRETKLVLLLDVLVPKDN